MSLIFPLGVSCGPRREQPGYSSQRRSQTEELKYNTAQFLNVGLPGITDTGYQQRSKAEELLVVRNSETDMPSAAIPTVKR